MQHTFAVAMLLIWAPTVLILFRLVGPRWAAAIGLVGGYLLLPRSIGLMAFDYFRINRSTAGGLGMAAGILLFGRDAIRSARPRWLDLVMILFVAAPAVESAISTAPQAPGSLDQSWLHLFAWAVPYAVGRLYFGTPEARRWLAVAVVVAAVAYLPLVAFEVIAGPRYYLARLAYGLITEEGLINRLGGWRPEVFLNSGIELAHWMAMASILAAWLSACRNGWWPARVAVPFLILATLACRGIYGYLILGVGLVVVAATLATGTRWVVVALLLVYPSYVGARLTGAWDGRGLVEGARRMGRPETVAIRLQEEDAFCRDVRKSGLLLGRGGRYFRWEADNWWASTLKGGGLVGLAIFYAAFTLPAAWAAFRTPPRSVEFGLALFIILHVIDGLHNTSLVAPATLFGGALLGRPPVARPEGGGGAVGTVRYRIR